MKTIILTFFLTYMQLFAYSTELRQVFAVAIADSKGNSENIQNVRVTKNDYSGTCYTKIFINGRFYNQKPTVKIGTSIGHYQSSQTVYNKKTKIGKILIYKHYRVKSGMLKVYFGDTLYDSRVKIK